MQFREDGPIGMFFEDYEVGQKMARSVGGVLADAGLSMGILGNYLENSSKTADQNNSRDIQSILGNGVKRCLPAV